MTHRNTHAIITTFFNRSGHLESKATGIIGCTYAQAYEIYLQKIAAYEQRPKVAGAILIDANEVVQASWNKEAKEVA